MLFSKSLVYTLMCMCILCCNTSVALVTRISKLNDVVTNVGQMFNYTIPKNTFDQQETVSRYEAKDYTTGSSTLPSWLSFDQSSARFTGFPTSGDEGSYRYRIEAISMQGTTNQLSAETEVTIIVSDGVLPLRKISYIEREGNECPTSEKVRVVNIVLQINLATLNGDGRISLIEKLASKYQLHRHRVYLHHGDKGVPIIGQSYIEANAPVSGSIPKGTISWAIGCENVMTGKQYGNMIRNHIADGTFSQTVGSSIAGYNFVLGVPIEDAVTVTAVPSSSRIASLSSRSTTTISYTLVATPSITATLPSSSVVKSYYVLTPIPSQSVPSASKVVTSTILTSENQQLITATPTSPVTDISITPTTIVQERPRVDNPIGKIILTAGLIRRIPIPANTFSDKEDGDTTKLSLNLFYGNNSEVSKWSWLQLDKSRQELYGLPLTSNPGSFIFQLEATDSSNQKVRDVIEITVERSAPSKLLFEFALEVPYEQFATELKLRIDIMEDISRLVGDQVVMLQLNNFHFTSFRNTRVVFSNYTINSLPCNPDLYSSIIRKIESIKSVAQIEVYKASGILNCVYETTSTVVETLATTPVPLPTNRPPSILKSLGQLDAFAGRIFEFQIPPDMFLDEEDGYTANLSLALLTRSGLEVNSWIAIKGSRLIGLPLEEDSGIRGFLLRAADSHNAMVYDPFNIRVNSLPQQYNYVMSLVLDLNYNNFMRNLTRRIGLVTEIARAFSDNNPRNLCLRSITSGSVNISWTNVALDTLSCNASIYERLTADLIELRNKPVFMTGLYPATNSTIRLSPECRSITTVIVPTAQPVVNWIGTVLPATLSACLFIILILIIFFMYRNGKLFGNKKSRRDKTALKVSGGKDFLRKNRPVIMDSEADDKPNIVSNPIMVTAEKPPQDPPIYSMHTTLELHSETGSSSSLTTKAKVVHEEDEDDDITVHHNKNMGSNFNSILLMEDFNPESPKPPQY